MSRAKRKNVAFSMGSLMNFVSLFLDKAMSMRIENAIHDHHTHHPKTDTRHTFTPHHILTSLAKDADATVEGLGRGLGPHGGHGRGRGPTPPRRSPRASRTPTRRRRRRRGTYLTSPIRSLAVQSTVEEVVVLVYWRVAKKDVESGTLFARFLLSFVRSLDQIVFALDSTTPPLKGSCRGDIAITLDKNAHRSGMKGDKIVKDVGVFFKCDV